MARHANVDWLLPEADERGEHSWQSIHAAILMDIRAELRQINMLLNCPNTLGIPHTLKRIQHNTAKPRKKVP